MEQADRLPLSPEIDETIPSAHDDLNKTGHLTRQEVEEEISANTYLMDISSDMQWICYVTQHHENVNQLTTTLTVRRFSAVNDVTGEKEYCKPVSVEGASAIHIDDNSGPNAKSICINEYFDTSKFSHKFLSISPGGQYVTISNYREETQSLDGGCVVFAINEKEISFHCEMDCNGRAVFLDRKDELCLAILDTEALKIYRNIRIFSKELTYELYDLTAFKVEVDFDNYSEQSEYNTFAINWTHPIKSGGGRRSFIEKVWFVIAFSSYIKNSILITPYTSRSDTIRFWSLKDNGVRLATVPSTSSSPEAVIAISKDLQFIATIDYSHRLTVNVYNAQNGCLAYILKIKKDDSIIHAAFYCNSRYLYLTIVRCDVRGKEDIAFEVWHIAEQKMIYTTTKSHGNFPLYRSRSEFKPLKPFVLEEIAPGGSPRLKGFYSYSADSKNFIIKCFEINIDGQLSTAVKWLERKRYRKYNHNFHNFETSDDPQGCKHNNFLDSFYKKKIGHLTYDVGDPLDCYSKLKCGFIKSNYKTFLLRCGLSMIQLWQINEPLRDTRSYDLEEDSKLVYIKSYTNPDRKSWYFSPKLWRVQSFESLKIFGESPNLKLVAEIIENPHEKTTSYTEEIILTLSEADHSFNYRKFEDACQSLFFMRGYEDSERYWFAQIISRKSMILVEDEIKKMAKNCDAFKTPSASKTLGMLASFQTGRNILKLLLKNELVSFNISEYAVVRKKGYISDSISLEDQELATTEELLKNDATTIIMTESVLTVLIREHEYQLYHLFFNRVLFDSKNADPDCLSIIVDALLLLQELGNIDQYQQSFRKLSHLRCANSSLLPSEVPREIPQMADFQEDLIGNISNLYIFSAKEQMHKATVRKNHLHPSLFGALSIYFIEFFFRMWGTMKVIWTLSASVLKDTQTKPSNEFVMCVVPLPYFNTYYRTSVQDAFNTNNRIDENVQSSYGSKSLFLQSALDQHKEPNIWKQGDDVMAVVLQYKWNAFIRKRFFFVCIIHLMYYVCYCTGVQFAFEMYGYDSNSKERSITANAQHVASLTLFFISGFILLALEFNQIIRGRTFFQYFKSGYNYVDIAAIVFPLITFLQMICDWNYFNEVSSICTLVLWLHGIIRLRVFSSFGIALEIILQLFRKVNSVLFILLIVVFGFTHSFIVLLRQREDQYFQENYSGETTLDGNSTMAGNTTLYDLSSSNGFTDPYKAFYQVWLFIFGVWDPITTGDAGDNRMLFALCIIFAFITVLIFTNMIIALMSSTVEEVKQRGKKVWLTHFAAVIAEIESLTSESTRTDRVNNPAFIFYAGNAEKVNRQEEKLRQETKELRKILKIDEDEQMQAAEDLKSSTLTKLKKVEDKLDDLEGKLEKLYQLLIPMSQ